MSLVAKHCDYLPLNRQSQSPANALKNRPVGGPGSPSTSQKMWPTTPRLPGRTKTGRLRVYAREDRPWSGAGPPAALYLY